MHGLGLLRDAASDLPRYLQVAKDLADQIAAGKFPIGSHLLTEMELCQRYNISRYTAREALRQLRDAGLVSRHRKSGTKVIALVPPTAYRQPIASISNLLQYGEDTKMRIRSKGRIVCNASLAKVLDCEPGREWLGLETLRVRPEDGCPICLTKIHVNVDLPGIDEKIESLSGPISAMLEEIYGLRIARIEQGIQATLVSARQAKLLRVEARSPALRAVRKYYDEDDRLIEFADAIHPGERFTYVMRLTRD
jgi:GntR family transcriptional regulator